MLMKKLWESVGSRERGDEISRGKLNIQVYVVQLLWRTVEGVEHE